MKNVIAHIEENPTTTLTNMVAFTMVFVSTYLISMQAATNFNSGITTIDTIILLSILGIFSGLLLLILLK